MMALDGKTIIKEEITDKDAYEASGQSAVTPTTASVTAAISRRHKGNGNGSGNTSISTSNIEKDISTTTTTSTPNNSSSSNSSGSCTSHQQLSHSLTHNHSHNQSSLHTPTGRERERERERERDRERDRSCRTPPDSPPEAPHSVGTRSPLSPPMHTRPQRNASASPIVNGAATSPPPLPLPLASAQQQQQPPPQPAQAASLAAAAAAAAAHVEQARLIGKIRKFLGALVQFGQEQLQPEIGERVRALVLSLCSGAISIEEFRLALHDAISLPLRPYVMPLLKNSMTLLQREILALARATNQSTLQYVTSNEQAVMEFAPHGGEYSEIFVQLDGPPQVPLPPSTANGGSAGGSAATAAAVAAATVFKRRSSDSMMEHGGHNGLQEWSEYMASAYPPPTKRLAMHGHSHSVAQPALFDYSSGSVVGEMPASTYMQREREREREERDLAARHVPTQAAAPRTTAPSGAGPPSSGGGAAGASVPPGGGGEEEWKNIHTMLNCISAMVDKTKRAITILQQRGIEPQQAALQEVTPAALAELRRQTEEKVAEFKRNAEDAVTQVKRQAVIEIQRAVVNAETRAAEIMTQERLRMEKFFMEMSRHSSGERDLDNKSPSITAAAQNGNNMQQQCWNCGRKATETCSGCNMARYCSASCQYRDWDSHHQVCGNSRTTELSAKHLHSASLRSAMATRSPPAPTSVASSAHLQVSVQSTTAPGNITTGANSGGGGNAGGGGGGGSNTAVAAATPSALVPNGLSSK